MTRLAPARSSASFAWPRSFDEFRPSEPDQAARKVAAAGDLVTVGDDARNERGKGIGDATEYEEGSLGVVFSQELQRCVHAAFDAWVESIPMLAAHRIRIPDRPDVEVVFDVDREDLFFLVGRRVGHALHRVLREMPVRSGRGVMARLSLRGLAPLGTR